MLNYVHEGLLEVESQAIRRLCRSRAPVIVGDPDRDTFEINAVVCNFLNNSAERCLVAFHARTLKRALVYAVADLDGETAWWHGREVLGQLGFQLEDVTLKLSPAMLEVVLRDIPGLATPGEAHRLREERASAVAELQNTHYRRPDTAAGTRAANKLKAEQRMDERTLALRQALEELLAPAEALAEEQRAHLAEIQELNERLAVAEARAEAERREREVSETITAAAEKRIQELEASLVEMETLSAQTLKQKRKLAKLQQQVKEINKVLADSQQETAQERDLKEQSIKDARAAERRISTLEKELAELQGLEEGLKDKEDLQLQLTDSRQALQEALERQQELATALAKAVEKGASLAGEMKKAEVSVRDLAKLEEQLAGQAELNARLTTELADLREKYDREAGLRNHLEEAATQNEKRLGELKKSLARALEDAAQRPGAGKDSIVHTEEAKAFQAQLQEQAERIADGQQAREELETELRTAHDQIKALESAMSRQKGQAAKETSDLQTALNREQAQLAELQEQLQEVEGLLDRERAAQKDLASSLTAAEKRLADIEKRAVQPSPISPVKGGPDSTSGTAPKAAGRSKSSKPLPHEVRPAAKKDALFNPDWDLAGLPCRSADQVSAAWGSAFNVQISPEGYPSQYCTAFLVVLNAGEEKRLYLVYRLKKSRHTLVTVPARRPEDETSMQKTINEGLKYLKRSGFDMEEISADRFAGTLASYFEDA